MILGKLNKYVLQGIISIQPLQVFLHIFGSGYNTTTKELYVRCFANLRAFSTFSLSSHLGTKLTVHN